MNGGMTRRQGLGLLAGAGVAALLSRARPLAAKPVAPCAIAVPLEGVTDRLLAHVPETATYNSVPQSLDGGPLAALMDDYTPAGESAWRAALATEAEALARLDCPTDAAATLHLDIARAIVENGRRSAAIPYGRTNPFGFSGHVPYLVTQIAGPHIDTPAVMLTQQSVSSPAAVETWLDKLEGFDRGFDGVIEKLRADRAAGCRPPAALLQKTLPVLDASLAGDPAAHPLVVSLAERMETAGLAADLREKAVKRAARGIERRLRPAFARLREEIVAMLPDARAEAGVWAQPDGDALYAANVGALGDTTLAPAEVHRMGVDEVARITAQMDRLLRLEGLTRGSVGARMEALGKRPGQQFADSDAGRAALLDYVREAVRRMEARYPEILPEAMIPRQPLEVRRVPVATEEGAPGGYYDGPALDGSRPGTYWINLRDMAAVPRLRLPTLSYHEGVPGHHTQSAIATALGEAPLIIRIASFNAYQEGWGLYAERLAAEMGVYRRDRPGDLGRLQDELFRAVRLVVDTGLHDQHWDRPRAIAYMRDATGVAESRVVAEIERYMAWPGQALGYKLGQLRLLDLRGKLQARKGKRFDRRAFHATVLGNGAMPMALVEREVMRL